MIRKRVDKKYKFVSVFDTSSGAYVRSGIIKDGKDTGEDPFMASFPHLIDIGIMGHCIHGKTGLCSKAGIECYQSGQHIHEDNMTVENFKKIIEQCKDKVDQVALGGRGDPDQHENFEEILKLCRENNIVPNYTTSGLGLTKDKIEISKKYCGAVAVSWYRSKYTLDAINNLLEAGIKTNIHYVISNRTIDEAIERLENNDFPNVNAVIFLLHKPAGQGAKGNVLRLDDERVTKFYKLVQNNNYKFGVGIDTCNFPAIVTFNNEKEIDFDSIDTCEGARYSCYIGNDLIMTPCSFDVKKKYGIDLNNNTIEQGWESKQFEEFRSIFKNACPKCNYQKLCLGGCPLYKEIVLCKKRVNEYDI
ncbi:MAG: radical SAM protein [Clostridia bacterium]|nr:radical SAM protein [Clostridia bacterium]